MQHAICSVPCSPVRSAPSHQSEMVNQLIFGESCSVSQIVKSEWVHIKSSFDNYEGFVQFSHLTEVESAEHESIPVQLTADWISTIEYNGVPMKIPLGSRLTGIRNGTLMQDDNTIRFSGKTWDPKLAEKEFETLKNLCIQFLNTAYLWGGKTVFGTDCSGFTQTIFQFFNISLQRDAWQQAEQGILVNSLEEARPADLAFFESPGGKITHVGIIMQSSEIIHASGKVRIDRIDLGGILSSKTGNRTHILSRIKRFF
ncbi:MAG: NlpC/P60 family protein [Chitinophagales bacterium]